MSRDNGDLRSKLMVRNFLLKEMGGLEKCRVLELYGGLGVIHDNCYKGAKKHMAFEKRPVDRPTWVMGDNRKLLPIHINEGWDLIDADSYDNPWLIVSDVMRLAPKGKFTVAVTCGIKRGLKCATNGFIRQKSGLNDLSTPAPAVRWYDDIARWVIDDWRQYGVKVHKAKRIYAITNTLKDVWYWGFVVSKE